MFVVIYNLCAAFLHAITSLCFFVCSKMNVFTDESCAFGKK